MGALPKKKQTAHRKGRRRAVIKLQTPTLVKCASCQATKVAHHQCEACGK